MLGICLNRARATAVVLPGASGYLENETMSARVLAILAIALFLGGMGLLRLVAKDWLWDRHETLMRARGLVNLERTPEWENQQNLLGLAMLIVAAVLVVLSTST
jgi:hypothetical protein